MGIKIIIRMKFTIIILIVMKITIVIEILITIAMKIIRRSRQRDASPGTPSTVVKRASREMMHEGAVRVMAEGAGGRRQKEAS